MAVTGLSASSKSPISGFFARPPEAPSPNIRSVRYGTSKALGFSGDPSASVSEGPPKVEAPPVDTKPDNPTPKPVGDINPIIPIGIGIGLAGLPKDIDPASVQKDKGPPGRVPPGFDEGDLGTGFVPTPTDVEKFVPTPKTFGGDGVETETIPPGFDATDLGNGLTISSSQAEGAIPTPPNFGGADVLAPTTPVGFDETDLGTGLVVDESTAFAPIPSFGGDISIGGTDTATSIGSEADWWDGMPAGTTEQQFSNDLSLLDDYGIEVGPGALVALAQGDVQGAAVNVAVGTIMKETGASAALAAGIESVVGAEIAAMIPYVGWAIAAYTVIQAIIGGDSRKPSEAVILTDQNTNEPFFDARNFGGSSNAGDNAAVLAPQINAINTWLATLPPDIKASLREVQHEQLGGPDATLDQAWNALLGKLADEAVNRFGYSQADVNAALQSAPRITLSQAGGQVATTGLSDQEIQTAAQQGGTPQQLIERGIAAGVTLADAERALGVTHQEASDYVQAAGYDPGGCFITEAVMSTSGQGDNAEELQVLRGFRDTVLMASPQGQEMVNEYYAIAPVVVEAVAARPDGVKIFQDLKAQFIDPAVAAVKAGDNEQALQIYAQMIAYATQFASEGGGEGPEQPGAEAGMENLGADAQMVADSPDMAEAATGGSGMPMAGQMYDGAMMPAQQGIMPRTRNMRAPISDVFARR